MRNESCIFVFTEKLYNVDEALLSSMEEKQRILSEEMERLEKESHTVRSVENCASPSLLLKQE